MNARRLIVPLVNLVVFVAAGIALYELGNGRAAPATNSPDDDYQGPTSVAVNVTTVSRQTLSRMVTAYGKIEPAPPGKGRDAGTANIGAPFAGIVGEMDCVEGQRVHAGDALFTMDSRSAEADIGHAQMIRSASQTALEEIESANKQGKLPDWAVTIGEWQKTSAQAALDRAEAERQLLTVKSPISGVVSIVLLGPGETAQAGATVIEVVDPQRVVLALDVPGFLVGDVKVGQAVLLDVPEHGGSTRPATSVTPATQPSSIKSQVLIVDPSIDPASGMASVDVEIVPDPAMKPGQFLRARIVVEQRQDCLVVPSESIVRDSDGNTFIGVVDTPGKALLRPVELGLREGDLIEIRADGLEAGQTVVTSGASALRNRTDIRLVGK